ncbi:MAG TPA: hypothetical protein VKA40_09245 [Nitrososphaera sp.]|nr:hypothetical protein [Nitrososphaera sp.]
MALVFQVIEMSRIRSGRRNDKERLEEGDDDNSSELINYNFIVSFGLTIYTHIHTLSMSHIIS